MYKNFAGLTLNGGWKDSAMVCESHCRSLLNELIRSSDGGLVKLAMLDTISQTLCSIIDRAELARNVHPNSSFREDAEFSFSILAQVINELNTSSDLYNAVDSICNAKDFASYSEEAQRTAVSFRDELEANGAHLEQNQHEEVARLQNEIQDLMYAFNCGNSDALGPLLQRRKQLANMMGYESYASYKLTSSIMKTPQNVLSFLDSVEDMAENSRSKRDNSGSAQPFQKIKVRDVVSHLVETTEEIFGVRCVEVEDKGVWHPSVFCFNIDGGVVYMDLFKRKGKSSFSATYAVSFDVENEGPDNVTRCALVTSLDSREDYFLQPSEVETLFHEWGHVLASLLNKTTYQQLAGTRATLDFVETPSLLWERFCWDERVTGWKRPFKDARMELKDQLLMCRTDIALHGELDAFSMDDIRTVVSEVRGMDELKKDCNFVRSFTHLGPYGSSYYTYLLCNVFSSNVWNCNFREDLREGGRKMRDEMLRHGGAKNPETILRKLCANPFEVSSLKDLN